MTIQLVVVAGAIAMALAYVGRATVKTWFGTTAGCGNGCGKCSAPAVENTSGRVSLL